MGTPKSDHEEILLVQVRRPTTREMTIRHHYTRLLRIAGNRLRFIRLVRFFELDLLLNASRGSHSPDIIPLLTIRAGEKNTHHFRQTGTDGEDVFTDFALQVVAEVVLRV